MKNRNKTEIIARILNEAGNGCNKTKIMYGAYISSKQLGEYLPFLQSCELIENGKETYKTTMKGKLWLQKYRELDKLTVPKTSM